MTFKEIRSKIRSIIRDITQSKLVDGEINDFINEGYHDLLSKLPTSNNATAVSGTLTTGTESITFGATVRDINSIRITNSGKEYYLKQVDLDWFVKRYPNTADDSRAVPMYWYVSSVTGAGVITAKVYPIPDQSYTYVAEAQTVPAIMTADADIPSFPAEFHSALVNYGSGRAFEVLGDINRSELEMKRYNEKINYISDKLNSYYGYLNPIPYDDYN